MLNANSSKVGHTHDDRYYTEAESNAMYLKKSTSRSDTSSGAVQVRSSVDGNTNYHLNSGIYTIGPSDIANPTGSYGVMLTLNTSHVKGNDPGAWIKQLFFPNGQIGIIYIRENINYAEGKWTGWKRFSGTSV